MAAAALLVDYMMTVVVSIVAGVFAIGSAFPAANEHKVILSIAFVWLVTIANLRGTEGVGDAVRGPDLRLRRRRSWSMIASAWCSASADVRDRAVEPIHNAATAASAIGLFAILRAFSSGATALTGVEAISNGVPAFRRPQAQATPPRRWRSWA